MVYVDNVVVLFEMLEQQIHLLDIVLVGKLNICRRELILLAGSDSISLTFKLVSHCVEIRRLGDYLENVSVG